MAVIDGFTGVFKKTTKMIIRVLGLFLSVGLYLLLVLHVYVFFAIICG